MSRDFQFLPITLVVQTDQSVTAVCVYENNNFKTKIPLIQVFSTVVHDPT